MKLKTLTTLLLVSATAFTVTACGVGEARVAATEVSDAQAPLPVEVVTPVKTDIFATYHTTTSLGSDAEAPVVARVSGEVVDILVEEGDQVKSGQILARLDGDRLRLQMLQAQANLEKVRKEHERFVMLQKKGLVSASVAEGLRYDMDALAAIYKLRRLEYEYTNIRAPISGVVVARDIKIGQHVEVNDGAFHVTDTAELIAYLQIPQSELEKFAVGHIASVTVDAMPDTRFEAKIIRISPTIDMQTGTFRATAEIDNRDNYLAPGMFGRFDIAYEQHTNALVIPQNALVDEDSETVVYVVENGAASRRRIRTGIRSGEQIEVLDGLSEDDTVVVTGQGGLRDGSRVLASIDIPAPAIG